MPYIYLVSAVLTIGCTSVIGGFYNRRNSEVKNSSYLYSLLMSLTVFAFWLIMFITDRSCDLKVIWYSLTFGGFYAVHLISYIIAMKTGPVALTGLFAQLSLILVAVWGFIFWGSKINVLVIVGLILVGVSIWLCLYKGKADKSKEKFNFKWLIFALIALVANAGCAIVQRTQQTDFNGNYGNFMMMVATFISVIVCFALWAKDGRDVPVATIKKSWFFPVIAGFSNGFQNLFVILLATTVLSPSLVYPVLGVCGLIIVTLFSKFAFKEKLFWWQWVGILLGMASVAILSI